jgi:dienelactone hydrolase
MGSTGRRVGVSRVVVCALLVAAACGGSDSGGDAAEDAGYGVICEVVAHETTQDVLVFAPDAEGSWPVVMAMHGLNGSGEDMAEIATRLAREGFVVFAPTYRTDMRTQQGVEQGGRDAECGYRFARSIAADYGGDLDRPVTFVGWSLGASLVLALGLPDQIDPSGQAVSCFTEVPRPEVVVAVSGCHYEHEGIPADMVDPSGWGNKDAEIVLVAGEKDTTCAAWQSEDAATELRSAGYDVELVVLEGASHYAPVFHDVVDGEFVVVPDEPAGEQTLEVIVDAIAASAEHT